MDKSTKYFLWTFIILVVAFGILLSLRFLNPEQPTLDEQLTSPIEKDTDTEYTYSGFNFVQEGGFWYTQIKRLGSNEMFTIELRYDPKSLEDIPVEGNPNLFLIDPEGYLIEGAYVTFDPLGTSLNHNGKGF